MDVTIAPLQLAHRVCLFSKEEGTETEPWVGVGVVLVSTPPRRCLLIGAPAVDPKVEMKRTDSRRS